MILHLFRLICLLGLLLLNASWLSAETQDVDLQFRHFTSADGLAHSTVWETVQDPRGFIWISTEGGLQRFDGYELVTYSYRPDDPHSIPASEAFNLFADREGRLWLATRNRGLAYYEAESDRFRSFHPDGLPVLDPSRSRFQQTLDGTVWLMTATDLLRFDEPRHTFVPVGLEPASESDHDDYPLRPATFIAARDLLFWTDTMGRLFSWRPPSFGTSPGAPESDGPSEIDHPNARSIFDSSYLDSQGRIWLGSRSGELVRATLTSTQPDRWSIEPYPVGQSSPVASRSIGSIAAYGDDLWLAGPQGFLVRLPHALKDPWPAAAPVEKVEMRPGDPTSLSTDRIDALLIDRSGGLWASSSRGLDRADLELQGFRGLRRRVGGQWGLEGDHVTAIGEDRRGRRWLAGDGWLSRWDPRSHELTHARISHDGLDIEGVKALHEDRFGTFWLGAERGLFRVDPDTLEVEHADQHEDHHDQTRVIFEDSSQRLWLGGNDLRRIGPDGSIEARIDTRFVIAAAEDSRGRIWLGTIRGLQMVTPDERLQPLGGALGTIDDEVLALLVDSQDRLWIGLRDGGLIRKELAVGSLDDLRSRRFHLKSGLGNATVTSLLEGSPGFIWLGTQRGLSRLDSESQRFANFSTTDGVHRDSFFTGTALRSRSGELLFGGSGGLTYFDPSAMIANPRAPEVVLTGLSLDGTSIPIGHRAHGPADAGEPLTLSYRNRTFEVSFAALHFTRPERIRYLYRLNGFEETWNVAEAQQRRARYTNVDPGSYTFEVQAASSDGIWDPKTARLPVIVEAAPWMSPWAYALYAVLFLVVGSTFALWQQNRYNQERVINLQLRSAERRKDRLIANTSHELRTPLYGITGLAESLLQKSRDALPAETHRDISLIAASGRRLSRLVEDILDFSHIRSHDLTLRRRPFDLRTMIEDVSGLCGPAAELKGLELETALPKALPKVHVDPDRIFQVLSNLLENAVKFTEKGRIRIEAKALDVEAGHPGSVRITITDTGIGLDPTELGRLLQVFEQGDSSAARSYGGTGIGLSIADRLLDLHGSKLIVDSALGRGCTCWFDLPVAAAQHAHGSWQEESPAKSRARLQAYDTRAAFENLDLNLTAPATAPDEQRLFLNLGLSREARTARILAVDDEPTNLVILSNYLSLSSWRVSTAQNGAEALRRLQEETFDLVLLDVMMPQLSGYDVCRQLRQTFSIWELPIIFLSAKTKTQDAQRGLAVGANDYLTKPVTQHDLLTRIRPHLELVFAYRRMADRVEEKISQLKILGGLLPICSACKKIRDDQGYWEEIEQYIDEHSEAAFTHGVCPDCSREFLEEVDLA